jgi:hypothetical protein
MRGVLVASSIKNPEGKEETDATRARLLISLVPVYYGYGRWTSIITNRIRKNYAAEWTGARS